MQYLWKRSRISSGVLSEAYFRLRKLVSWMRAIAQALKPQPKYKPGAAKSADIHRLKR